MTFTFCVQTFVMAGNEGRVGAQGMTVPPDRPAPSAVPLSGLPVRG